MSITVTNNAGVIIAVTADGGLSGWGGIGATGATSGLNGAAGTPGGILSYSFNN